MKFNKIFRKNKKVIIGAIHFPPLLGYKEFSNFDSAFKNAIADLKAFEKGGADAIIFENNYDLPHKIYVDASVISSMTYLGQELRKATRLPMGINVLWNDYRSALSIAKVLNLQFIRVSVFVDKVKTSYGIVDGRAKEVLDFRKSIDAENIALFTDIHVKHAKILSKYSLLNSAKLAMKNKSDAVIITGKWTGDEPNMNELKNVRKNIGNFPILVGSGLNANNANKLFQFANGAIVSTSLKSGDSKIGEVNVKPCTARIDIKKVKKLINHIK